MNEKFDIEKDNKYLILIFTLVLLSIGFIFISLLVGSSSITVEECIAFLAGGDVSEKVSNIMINIRIPRAISGFLVGGTLALSGILLQIVLNNSLASASTIGVNSGAGLFVVAGTVFFGASYTTINLWAFSGALIVAIVVYFISYGVGSSRTTIILAGIAISSICNALIDVSIIYEPDAVFDKTAFYIGGLSGITMQEIYNTLPYIIIALTILIIIRKNIEILILGDEIANSLGVNVNRIRLLVIISVALLAGSAVSLAGLIGFVGLIVPHIVLIILGYNLKGCMVVTFMTGGIFVVVTDIIGRAIFRPYEISVGIIMALIGSSFFLYLLFTNKKRGRFL